MVEIEIGVPRGQCLDRQIDDRKALVAEIAAWKLRRNASGARIKCMFTNDRTRSEFARIYPRQVNES